MARISIVLVAALAVVAVADPIRNRRSTSNIAIGSAGLAIGQGNAADSNQQSVIATGLPGNPPYTVPGGWGSPDILVPGSPGLPATASIVSTGTSVVENGVLATQATDNEPTIAIGTGQLESFNAAYADDIATVAATGGWVAGASNGASNVAGIGATAGEQAESIVTGP